MDNRMKWKVIGRVKEKIRKIPISSEIRNTLEISKSKIDTGKYQISDKKQQLKKTENGRKRKNKNNYIYNVFEQQTKDGDPKTESKMN